MSASARPRVLALVGLTGTGKTDVACAIARQLGGEVISADSMQVYRGMDLGTAKPTAAQRASVPHHGLDLVDPDATMSAGHWAALARERAREAHARGHPIVLCGGTGLYARAFVGGLVGGIAADPEVRAELAGRSLEDLRRELEASDPDAAARIHANDRVRTERALEAARLAGRPLSRQQASHAFRDAPFDVRWLALEFERELLWTRLRERVDRMFEAGLVDEVRSLYARGYGPELRPLQAIGYKEVGELLRGERDEASAREAIWFATRRYAKRQRTWFKSEPGLAWCDASAPGDAFERAAAWLSEGR